MTKVEMSLFTVRWTPPRIVGQDYPGPREVTVAARGPDEAILMAARQWGEAWQQIAGWCTVVRLSHAKQPVCRRCKKEYGQPGDKLGGLCPECQRADELHRMRMRRIKRPDRRIMGRY